jgi:hypothetical protein
VLDVEVDLNNKGVVVYMDFVVRDKTIEVNNMAVEEGYDMAVEEGYDMAEKGHDMTEEGHNRVEEGHDMVFVEVYDMAVVENNRTMVEANDMALDKAYNVLGF